LIFFLIEKEYHNYFINSTYHKNEAKVFDSRWPYSYSIGIFGI